MFSVDRVTQQIVDEIFFRIPLHTHTITFFPFPYPCLIVSQTILLCLPKSSTPDGCRLRSKLCVCIRPELMPSFSFRCSLRFPPRCDPLRPSYTDATNRNLVQIYPYVCRDPFPSVWVVLAMPSHYEHALYAAQGTRCVVWATRSGPALYLRNKAAPPGRSLERPKRTLHGILFLRYIPLLDRLSTPSNRTRTFLRLPLFGTRQLVTVAITKASTRVRERTGCTLNPSVAYCSSERTLTPPFTHTKI